MASAVPVFGIAILFSLAVAGRELSRSPDPVKLPKDVAQSSSHAKPAGQPRIDPDRALLATLLAATDPASVPDQPESVTEPDAGYDSNSATGEMNVALTSAMSPVSEGNAPEQTETIHPAEPMGDTLGNKAITSTGGPLETVPGLKAQEPASRSSKKPNRSAYGAGVYVALGRHKPRSVERGSTTVTFAIEANGALGNVRIGQSSGNVQLDQMAIQMVRDAAPFSPPPHGASSYTIRIDFQ